MQEIPYGSLRVVLVRPLATAFAIGDRGHSVVQILRRATYCVLNPCKGSKWQLLVE
jgi:hypothetical protein